MGDIDVIIADSDIEYMELFKKYIRESDYQRIFSIKSFTNPQTLEALLESNLYIDILLITPNFLQACDFEIHADTIIVLTDTTSVKEYRYKEKNYPHFYKYQPLNQIISKMFSHYNNGSLLNLNESTKLVAVYSTTGGSGKTTVAINLARHLSERKKKVFYLSLEEFSSIELFFNTEQAYDMSKIIYYLKTDPEQLTAKLEEMNKKDPKSGIEFIEAVANPKELREMSLAELELLLEVLVEMKKYDFIILDLESGLDERVIGAFQKSDTIIWLLLNNIHYLKKTEALHRLLKNEFDHQFAPVYKKVKFVFNQYLGDQLSYPFMDDDFTLYSSLPYVPAWSSIRDISELYNQDEFNEAINYLYQKMLIR